MNWYFHRFQELYLTVQAVISDHRLAVDSTLSQGCYQGEEVAYLAALTVDFVDFHSGMLLHRHCAAVTWAFVGQLRRQSHY